MFSLSNMLIPAILFFALGFMAQLVRSDLKFPADLAKALSIYLLVAIGLHGGMELAKIDPVDAIGAIVAALGWVSGCPSSPISFCRISFALTVSMPPPLRPTTGPSVPAPSSLRLPSWTR